MSAVLENICCFIGHRKINVTDELKEKMRYKKNEHHNYCVAHFYINY